MGTAPLERNAMRGEWGRSVFKSLAVAAVLILFFAFQASGSSSDSAQQTTVILVVGAPGNAELGSNFVHQATLWEAACAQGNCALIKLGLTPPGETNDFALLKDTLATEPKDGLGPLWLVLIGHGTFDGKEAKFNLRGPDISASDLSLWLQPFQRPLVVLNTASCSAPFLNKLSATNRVIITATRSGHEQNFTHFGQYFAEAIANPEADLDKDGQVSLLEAFLTASRKATEFYKVQGRLATEHALLDDNGDGRGTPADWFRGLRATKKPKDAGAVDGAIAQQFCLVPSQAERQLTAEQRAQRDSLEREVFRLREKKEQLAEDEYYRQMEGLLLQLANCYGSNLEQSVSAPVPKTSTAADH
jgi:hypothetical protein